MLKKAMGKGQPCLRADRYELLNQLAEEGKFTWAFTMEHDEKWKMYYDALVTYSNEYSNADCNISRSERIKGGDGNELLIGSWLHHQREKYHSNRLKEKHFLMLQELVDSGRLRWENNEGISYTSESAAESDSQSNHFVDFDLLKDANDLEMLRFLNDNDSTMDDSYSDVLSYDDDLLEAPLLES
jgi:hypothetical protein